MRHGLHGWNDTLQRDRDPGVLAEHVQQHDDTFRAGFTLEDALKTVECSTHQTHGIACAQARLAVESVKSRAAVRTCAQIANHPIREIGRARVGKECGARWWLREWVKEASA